MKLQNHTHRHKSVWGQFYTTKYAYILQGLNIPEHVVDIIEPFVGEGHLLHFIKEPSKYKIELFDIDPKIPNTTKQDTLKTSPNYDNKFVLTNPPYLARNKSQDKTLYDTYKCNDLYKIFILQLTLSKCEGGIIIIPLNFFCSLRKADVLLRKRFFNVFDICKLNLFEEQVFEDTAYTVCSFSFTRKTKDIQSTPEISAVIDICIFPDKKIMRVSLSHENNYSIGGEIYALPQNKDIYVGRATTKNYKTHFLSNILLKCIDDGPQRKLGFNIVDNDIAKQYIDTTHKLSARSYATIVFKKEINLEKQRKIVSKANTLLNNHRETYHSLFLTNYRESKKIARKRISFDLAFSLINHVMSTMDMLT